MIKIGMLLQWKSTDRLHWGLYFKEKPSPKVEKVKIENESTLTEHLLLIELLQLEQKKLAEISQLPDDEHRFNALKSIYLKYLLKEKDIESKIYYFQYILMAINKFVRIYKIGNVLLKKKIYWECMLTKQNGDTSNIWVEEDDVEPYMENSYNIKNILLAKHLARRAAKKK